MAEFQKQLEKGMLNKYLRKLFHIKKTRKESIFINRLINYDRKNEAYQFEIYKDNQVILEVQPLSFVKSWLAKTTVKKNIYNGYILFFWIPKHNKQKNKLYKNIVDKNLIKYFFDDVIIDEKDNLIYFTKFFSMQDDVETITDSIYFLYSNVYDLKKDDNIYGSLIKIPTSGLYAPNHDG